MGRSQGLPTFKDRYALRAPWKTHRRVSTRGLTSSAAHGRLPTHGPCAFNRACSCPHHKAVCPQPPTQWLPLAGSELSCPHRGIPTDRPRTTKRARMGLQGCTPPSTAHQGFPTCGPRTEWSSPQGCAPSTPMKVVPTRGPRAVKWAQRDPHLQSHGSCVFNHARSGRHHKDVSPQSLTQWFLPASS